MDKKLLFALVMSTATVLLFHYFTQKGQGGRQTPTSDFRAGEAYRIPTREEIEKPLNREIDFVDKKIKGEEVLTTVETDLCKFVFSNFGGVIATVDYKKRLGKERTPLRTVYYKDFFNREEGCFLLVLAEKTPYFYRLISSKDFDGRSEVVYQTEADGWLINKTYTVYKNIYQLDLALEFLPKAAKSSPIQARLFFPSPFVNEVPDNSSKGFTFSSRKNSVQAVDSGDELVSAWPSPEVFGGQDRYFAHAVIGDKDHFVRRSYYKRVGGNDLFSILDGPEVDQKATWNLSFYLGPKDLEDMAAVDGRLEGLLNFGWLSWLCKLLLKLLSMIYGYVHNYGLAIIILTILIKIPFLPLTIKSSSMMEKYQKYQPQITRIREKYKQDVQRQQAEILRFHKEHNISPATQLVGCLPLLIDLPIMYALWNVLVSYMDLYNAPFFAWITDLSVRDPYFVLPVLMGVSMFWQQKTTPIGDEKQRIIMWFMTILMTAIFSGFAAGLVLYWFTKNILTIGETYFRKVVLKK